MKSTWEPPDEDFVTDKILWHFRAMNMQDPLYSQLKSVIEKVCGPSEYNETKPVKDSNAFGRSFKKPSSGLIQ